MLTEFKLAIFFLTIAVALTFCRIARGGELDRITLHEQKEYSVYREIDDTYVIRITQGITSPEIYSELPVALSTVRPGIDSIRVDISTPGGVLESVYFISECIKAAKPKEFVVHTIGPTCSAGAYLACTADKITKDKDSFLMWHAAKRYLPPDSMSASEFAFHASDLKASTEKLLKPCVEKKIIDEHTARRIAEDKAQLYCLADGYCFENLNNPGD